MRLFIDTGPFVAYYNVRDKFHSGAVESFGTILGQKSSAWKLYTSDYVLDEALTACRTRTRNHKLSVQLGSDILSAKSIVFLKVDDEAFQQSWRLYRERSDADLSFTDCTVATLMKRHGINTVYTYDEDLGSLGLHNLSNIETDM